MSLLGMKLGDRIEIEGFDNMEPATLIVVKKMIGSSAKTISENHGEFTTLKIILKSDTKYELNSELVLNEKTHSANAKSDNLFFGLNTLFNELTKSIKT